MIDPRTADRDTAAESDGELDLRDILAQLLARLHWIVLAVVIGAGVGVYLGQLPPNIYRSNAIVQIEQRADRVALPSELIGDFLTGSRQDSGLATEVHIIRSRLVLQPVIEELGEQTIVRPVTAPYLGSILARRSIPFVDQFIASEYARPGDAIHALLTDMPDAYVGQRFRVRIVGTGQFEVIVPEGGTVPGREGEAVALPAGGALLVSDIRAPTGREFTVYEEPLRQSVGRLSSGLNIRERSNTGIVDFSYSGDDRDGVTEILNAVIEEYIGQNLQRRSVEIDRSIEFIEQQLLVISAESREAEMALTAYRQDRQAGELSAGTQQLLDAAVATEAALEEIAFQKEQLLQVLTVNHPDYLRLEAEETNLENRLIQIRNDLGRVPDVEQDLARLVERVESARTLEQQLRERVEQLRILRASAVGNIRVLEPAEVSQLVGPDRRRPIMIGAAVGFVLSVAGALALNMLRRGVEDGRDIEALGLSLFATVNKADVISGVSASDPAYGLAAHDPSNITVESLRALRTGLKFSLAAAKSKSLMITSCMPSDGKSFISLNLAIVTGQTGAKVLLVDADLRRGFLRRYFRLERQHPGLSDILAGSPDDHIMPFPKLGLDFIPAGRFPPNPSELLEGQAFVDFMDKVTKAYDLVIIDAPPALVVPDPGIIGQHVGMSMLVVKHLRTTPAEIQSAQNGLANSGVRLSGAILNQFDQSRSRYGRYGQKYGYYYGGYRYSYTRDDGKD